MAPKIDQAMIDLLISHHSGGLTDAEISRLVGKDRRYVNYHLRKRGMNPNRSLQAMTPAGCFSEINTKAKAYAIGFIAADGCVSRRGIEIMIHKRDAAALEYIKKTMGSQAKIEIRKSGPHVRFRPNGTGLVADMARHGITPRKSKTICWPTTIPDQLIWSFLLGYFDGDGSVGLYKIHHRSETRIRKPVLRPSVAILGSWPFIRGLKDFLSKNGIHFHVGPGCAGGSIAKAATGSLKQASALLRAMYTDAEFFLERKHAIASMILEKRAYERLSL